MNTTTSNIEHVNHLMISEFSKTLEMFALNKTESQLFVTMFLNEEPMTLDEMKESLGKSKTAMSTASRTLLDYNLIERVFKKGARRDLYQAKKDLYEKFMKTYVNRWLEALDQQITSLETIRTELNQQDNREVNMSNKINEAIKFHRSLEDVFEQISKYDQ
ncbi:GbsR/MarR family transcriptional regulator [Aquisalibacillus elongatus]|uniref:HTH-type transcriptional regulator n=1 Tax=Aquisalibacillus elongatus TaxID=485577 RepID=A0A3N5AYV9_9BACI|nr:hypothetical protein [Aquisalibacillus elongatus]RPF50167.1 DNA-binding transcriptional regulator GbsR (MarR family) [Aquisalibacillus elongatus]